MLMEVLHQQRTGFPRDCRHGGEKALWVGGGGHDVVGRRWPKAGGRAPASGIHFREQFGLYTALRDNKASTSTGGPDARSRAPEAGLLVPSAIFGDVHDLMFEDEQVGRTLAGQTHHVLVVVLDPAANDLSIHQLDVHRLLLLAQSLEEGRFFESILGRRRPAPLDGIGIPWRRTERHTGIVHKASEQMTAKPLPGKRCSD